MYKPTNNHGQVILSPIFHTGDTIRKHLKKDPYAIIKLCHLINIKEGVNSSAVVTKE